MRPLGISVIICCYNSRERLPNTLSSLANQEIPLYVPWEVVLVDNASTDNTSGAAEAIWQTLNSPVSLRVVKEATQGLSHARAKGVHEATYELVLFCDDDNWLSSDYVAIAHEIMTQYPDVGACGGRGIEVCEITPHAWFDKFKGKLAVGPQAATSGRLQAKRQYLYGAGMCVRRSLLSRLTASHIPSLLSDRSGTQLSSGGDRELCIFVLIMGYELWYDDRLRFKHYIPKSRLTWQYFRKLSRGFGRSRGISFVYDVLYHPYWNWKHNWWGYHVLIALHYSLTLVWTISLRGQWREEGNPQLLAYESSIGFLHQLLRQPFSLTARLKHVRQLPQLLGPTNQTTPLTPPGPTVPIK